MKYSRYAIGEIGLVVIGILIALQINQWNDYRIKRNLEVEFLKEIKDNLLKDKAQIDQILIFNKKKEATIQNTMYSFEKLYETVSEHKKETPKEILSAIQNSLEKFIKNTPMNDDTTILVSKFI